MDKKRLEEALSECDKIFSSSDKPLFPLPGALVYDLLTGEKSVFEIPDSWQCAYISGPALAARLWAYFAGEGCDEKSLFEQDNPAVITAGAAAGNAVPCGDLTCFAYRSPQDGRLNINSVSSFFGARLLKRGYCALVIKGRARRQSVLRISADGVRLEVTERYSMLTVSETYRALNLSNECSSVVTGPAGEKSVVYASAVSDGKTCGRGGLGYVLGLKNLKAAVVSAPVKDKPDGESFKNLYQLSAGKKGLSGFVRTANNRGWAPVNNFSLRTDPRLFYLSFDEMSRTLGNTDEIPPYDAVLMLGSNLGCYNPKTVSERCAYALENGFDPVSLGNILGWAREAQERGVQLFSKQMDFTDNRDVFSVISQIIYGTGFGFHARNGLEEVSAFYEASDYAYHDGGLESGCADVRGSFYQALCQSRRTWFPPYPVFFPSLDKKDTAETFEFFEKLSMGLECYGFSSETLFFRLLSLNKMRMKLVSADPGAARSFLSPEDEAATLSLLCSDESGKGCPSVKAMEMKGLKKSIFLIRASIKGIPAGPVTERDIFAAGVRCRILIDTVNSALGCSSMDIPDYFKTDPQSNFSRAEVVPFFTLCEEYRHFKALSEAGLF